MAQNQNNANTVKFMCSYGGRIHSRPTDHQLSYVGGDTKIISVARPLNFSIIHSKLKSLIANGNSAAEISLSLKYKLPGEDLDSLISLIDDDDVEHMMVEYDRMQEFSAKPSRLRLFVFNIAAKPVSPEPAPVTPSNPDYLFGFDKEYKPSTDPPLDLLPIPGMSLPEKEAEIPAEEQTAYRFSPVMNDGVYRSQGGPYRYWEQPVFHIIPMISPVSEQRMKVLVNNYLPR